MKKIIYTLLIVCMQFAIQAQEIPKHPLEGTWKWQSTNEDGSTRQGFRWYWTDSVVGVHRIAHASIDAETLKPIHGWSAFQTISKEGISDELWVDTKGRLGHATKRFTDKSSSITFTGTSESGNVSGIIELSWNQAVDTFKEVGSRWVGFDPTYQEIAPALEAQRIDYNPAEKGEVVWLGDERPILDPRLEDLNGKWESTNKDGHVNLSINFSPWDLGSSFLERFVLFDDEGNARRGGYNLTRKDPKSGQMIIFGIGGNGFSLIGGWDFMGGSTTGQRQGGNRLVRSFLSEDEIHAKWQSKENGQFIDNGNGYILKRKKTENDQDTETANEDKKRSYYQRNQDARKFTGFIKTDFKIVKENDVASYLAAEKEWKTLHEQIMQKGGLLHWHVAHIKNAKLGEPNYATVQVYASMEDMQNGSIWDNLDYSAVGSRASLAERTWPYLKHAGSDVYQAIDQYWSPDSGNMEIDHINMGYMSVRSGKTQDYVTAERTLAKPFWNVVSNLDSSFGGWAMHRLVESSRAGVNHDFATVHFKTQANMSDQAAWQSNTQRAMGILNKPMVDWDTLREMQEGPQFEIVLKANPDLHPVKNEWGKLKGNWKYSREDGSYRIKRISQGTEQLEFYDAEGNLSNQIIVPMKIEVKGGLNHFYSFHTDGTYHSIYKVHDNKWYEQMRGIWREGNGKPDAFLVYEKL